MLFTNTALRATERQMKFGSVTGISIGEFGRGRREVFLPTPKTIKPDDVIEELRSDLTIGLSKSGRPRIDARKDDDLYVVLSSARGFTRRGDGCIKVPNGQETELIARGNGADGDAGRIGTWDAVILKVREGDVFRITWAGYRYGFEPTYYLVSGGKVYVANQSEVEDLYESLGLDAPFSLTYDPEEGCLADLDEWHTI